jgi:plastocyanin
MLRSSYFSAAAACIALAGCSGNANALAPTTGPETFPVATGASDSSGAFEVLRYYPSQIVIDAGDTLTWTVASGSPHVIALVPSGATSPAPPKNIQPAGGTSYDGSTFVSSGLIAKGQTYSLTFPNPGSYTVLCLVHQPEMKQQVVVQAATAVRPSSPELTAASQAQSSIDVTAAQAVLADFPFVPNGVHLAAGLAPQTTPPSVFSIYRFLDGASLADDVTIPVGTTLTWTNASNVAHNVTFPVAGQAIPSSFNDFGPQIGGAAYDGSALTASGLLVPGRSYSLTFTRVGTYVYACTLHDDEGMLGKITVL